MNRKVLILVILFIANVIGFAIAWEQPAGVASQPTGDTITIIEALKSVTNVVNNMEATIGFYDDRQDQNLSNVASINAEGEPHKRSDVYVEWKSPPGWEGPPDTYQRMTTFENAYIASGADRE